MSQHRELTPIKLEYYTRQLAIKIGDHYYDKETIDEKLTHSATAYYYTAEEWAQLDPVLNGGEIGIDATNGFMKIGDGVHSWTELDYAIFPVSLSQRGDNLLLKDNKQDLFLGEAAMRNLILQVIKQYHGDESVTEFVTEDGYSFITADGYTFVQKETD